MIGGVCRNDRIGAGLRAGDRIIHAAQHIFRAFHRIPAKKALALGGNRCVRNGGQRSAVSHGLAFYHGIAVHELNRPIRCVGFHRDRAGNEGHGDNFFLFISNHPSVIVDWTCLNRQGTACGTGHIDYKCQNCSILKCNIVISLEIHCARFYIRLYRCTRRCGSVACCHFFQRHPFWENELKTHHHHRNSVYNGNRNLHIGISRCYFHCTCGNCHLRFSCHNFNRE